MVEMPTHLTKDSSLDNIARADEAMKRYNQNAIASGRLSSAKLSFLQRNKTARWVQYQEWLPAFMPSLMPPRPISKVRETRKCIVCGEEIFGRGGAKTCSISCQYWHTNPNGRQETIIRKLEKKITSLIEQGKKLDANFESYLDAYADNETK